LPDLTNTHPHANNQLLQRGLSTTILVVLVALSWSGILDHYAHSSSQATLTRALTTYALARGLNGVISVAQGTEVAIQPVGIGVTLTPGEILDPLNDLVERFSWLALLASASLGTQILMTELLANVWVSAALTLSVAVYLFALWWPRGLPYRYLLLRACSALIFARFLFTAVTLVSGWVDQSLLAERQAEGMAELQLTQQQIHDVQPAAADANATSLLERLNLFLDENREAMDIDAQLAALRARVEGAIERLVELMVVFLVQTIVIPVAGLALAYACAKWFWRWTRRAQKAVGDSAKFA
jgi:hypothetical protein